MVHVLRAASYNSEWIGAILHILTLPSAMPATENMPTPDAPFDSEIVHGGKFMLAALGRKLDSVIAYLVRAYSRIYEYGS